MNPLAQPIQIRDMEIKNRMYMPAMHLNMCMDYEVSDKICAFYERRAQGGVGAIAVGFVTVDPMGSMFSNIGAHDDRFLPGLRRLARSIGQHDCRSVAQINHQGRYAHTMFLDGKSAVAPSAIPCQLTGETPRELQHEEIKRLILQFGQTARRCKEASFDMVEILCGTGYLISQFLSPLTNHREDEWGGDSSKRMRFGIQVIEEVRRAVGEDYPVLVRMNGNDMMKGGMGTEALRDFAKALEDAGVDAFCINVGWHEARVPQITMAVPPANFAYLARMMKESLNRPVIASHRINAVSDAQRLLREGCCDMVGLGRALIADPDWPLKAMGMAPGQITHCIACGQGCLDHVFTLRPVECLCNPEVGHELEGEITPSNNPKKVAVVGGGVAGLAAARAAAKRGHRVTLYERQSTLGGQARIASRPHGRAEFLRLVEDLSQGAKECGVDVVLEHEATSSELLDLAYDAVILATGGRPVTPPLVGSDLPSVVQAWDVLLDRVSVESPIVVLGGGAVGVETAVTLAQMGTIHAETVKFLLIHEVEDPAEIRRLCVQGTMQVTLVEVMGVVGKDIGKSTRWTLTHDLKRYGVRVLTQTRAVEIRSDSVLVEQQNGHPMALPANTVVLALGTIPHCPLLPELRDSGIEVVVVGDSGQVGLAMDAVHQGYQAGRNI